MNKIFIFLISILLIFFAELFHFEAPPGAYENVKASVTTEALAEFNDIGGNINFDFGFEPEFNSQNRDDTSSLMPGQLFDPVTLMLLGSGLIGLAGLGRKKN